MSRILRRPMFRGGPVSSYGTGIASGLADGGAIGGGNIVGTKMADGRYGFANPKYVEGWNRIFGNTANKPLNITNISEVGKTGSQVATDATSKWSKAKNILKSPKSWRIPTDIQMGRGIWGGLKRGYGMLPKQGLLFRNPASILAAGAYFGADPTPVDEKYGITRWDNLFPMFGDTEESMMKDLERNEAEAANPNNWWRYDPGRYGPRKDHPDYDADKVSAWPWSDPYKETEGDKLKTETKVPDAITGEDPLYKERVVNNESGKPEPVELTAKEMIAENKEFFADILGAKEARGQDISEMLLGWAGAEGDTTWDKTKSFFRDEKDRPGKLAKIKENAAVLAINDYIAGKRSKENLAQTLGMKKSLIDYDYDIKSQIINVTSKDNFRQGLGKIAAKYKLDPTSVSTLKTYFAEVLGLKLHQVTQNYTLEKFEDKGWKDLEVGFNIVTPKKKGKMIIEKKADGTIDIKTNLVI